MKGDIVELWQDSHSESTPELCSRIWLGSSPDVAEVNLDDAHSQEDAISLIGMIPVSYTHLTLPTNREV
mgnify:CR=1 FL=1